MRQIFVNLPVKDLERSKQFFSSLGLGFDSKFADVKSTSEVLLALWCSSDRKVDDLVARATAAGGRPIIWELLHMRSAPQ